MTPPQHQQRPERTDRERERERRRVSRYDGGDSDTGTVRTLPHPHRPPMLPPLPPSSAGGSSTSSYVNPTTSTTARAETSMSRDRTIQAHHSQASSKVRTTREAPAVPATTRRSQHQYQQQSPQDPTSTGYLTSHLQSVADRQSQSPADAGRRRAETITTNSSGAAAVAAVASSSSSSSASIASSMLSRSGTARTVTVTTPVEVPLNVIPPRPTMATTMSTAGAGRISVSPTTTNPDWPMAGSPAAGGPSSRRHHHQQQQHQHHVAHHHPLHSHHSHRVSSVPTARPQSVEDDQDDMVLG